MTATELLESEYGTDKVAQKLIESFRSDGMSDEEIYQALESFY